MYVLNPLTLCYCHVLTPINIYFSLYYLIFSCPLQLMFPPRQYKTFWWISIFLFLFHFIINLKSQTDFFQSSKTERTAYVVHVCLSVGTLHFCGFGWWLTKCGDISNIENMVINGNHLLLFPIRLYVTKGHRI